MAIPLREGLGRLDYAVSLKPSIVILELGGNDGLRGVPVASTKANLESMIIAFQKAGAAVVLAGMTLPPNYGPDYIQQFEAAYHDLAAKYKAAAHPISDAGHCLATQIAEGLDAARRHTSDSRRPRDHRKYGLSLSRTATRAQVTLQ